MRIRRAVVCSILSSIAIVAVVVRSAPGGGKSKKTPIQGWSHIYVRALDAEKTCRFYHRVLGMEFVGWKTDGKKAYYYFESGGARICVGGFPKDPSDYKPKRLNFLSVGSPAYPRYGCKITPSHFVAAAAVAVQEGGDQAEPEVQCRSRSAMPSQPSPVVA